MEGVGSRYEHDAREVVIHVQVVVVEGVVLLGVKDFKKGRRRVSPEIDAHLVHLVQEKDGVDRSRLFHELDYLSRQRPDVGPPVAPYLGLVPHAAQGNPHELPPQRPGDRLGKGRFPHARGADEAENRAFQLVHQLADGEVLEDALLGLFEPVVVLVEDPGRPVYVDLVVGLLCPGERDEPVDIGPAHRRLRRHGRHHLQPLELAEGLLRGLLRHALLLDLLLEFGKLGLLVIPMTQLVLDRLHLLAQVELPLGLFHLLFHPAANPLFHLEYLYFPFEMGVNPLEPLCQRCGLEQLLFILYLEGKMPGDRIGKLLVIFDAGNGHQKLRGQFLAQLHVLLEGALHVPGERFDADPVGGFRHGVFDEDLKIALLGDVVGDFRFPLALHEHLDRPVRHLHHLDDGAYGSHPVDMLRFRVILSGILLRCHHDDLVLSHRFLDGPDGLLPAHEKGGNHRWEYHHVPERKKREHQIDRIHVDLLFSS